MGSVDIWVMKKYGEVESWFRVISLGATDIGVDVLGVVIPLIYSECRKKVLIERDHTTLLWYDLEKKSAESVELGGCEVSQWFNSIVVLESPAKPCHPDKKDAKRGAGKNDEKSNKRHSHRDAFLSTGFKLKL
ncbi:hypothetical protein LIER_36114 [Lithospermum erythrorhizon]|uniref:F-box protein n=1 Tax=Lithospermum erythrorhizon TaxID=34254 RepID=A0AAV3P2T8_LITER